MIDVDQGEDENDDGVIPSDPVAIFDLLCVRHSCLRKIVSDLESSAGVIVTPWVRERKVADQTGNVAGQNTVVGRKTIVGVDAVIERCTVIGGDTAIGVDADIGVN